MRECWRLLKPKGKLFLARINAYRYTHFMKGSFQEISKRPGSFSVAYTKKQLRDLLHKYCPGHSVVHYRKTGFLLPLLSKRAMQKLYGFSAIATLDLVVNTLFPFLGIHHFVVLQKND